MKLIFAIVNSDDSSAVSAAAHTWDTLRDRASASSITRQRSRLTGHSS